MTAAGNFSPLASSTTTLRNSSAAALSMSSSVQPSGSCPTLAAASRSCASRSATVPPVIADCAACQVATRCWQGLTTALSRLATGADSAALVGAAGGTAGLFSRHAQHAHQRSKLAAFPSLARAVLVDSDQGEGA